MSADDAALSKDWSSGVSSTGYVTFTSLVVRAAVTQCQVATDKSQFETFAAPTPQDVLWQNVTT